MTTDDPAPKKGAVGQGPACRDVGQLRQEVLEAIGAGDHPEKRQKGSLLVPIRVNVDREDGEDVREHFLWRLGEPGYEVRPIAVRLAADLQLPQNYIRNVEEEMQRSLRPFATFKDLGGPRLVRLQLYVRREGRVFRDEVEWDVGGGGGMADQAKLADQGEGNMEDGGQWTVQAWRGTCRTGDGDWWRGDRLGLHDPAWATAIAGQLEELAREAAEDLLHHSPEVAVLPPAPSVWRPQPATATATATADDPPYDPAQDLEAERRALMKHAVADEVREEGESASGLAAVAAAAPTLQSPPPLGGGRVIRSQPRAPTACWLCTRWGRAAALGADDRLRLEAVERWASGQASPLARFPSYVSLTLHLEEDEDPEVLIGLALFGTAPEARQQLTRVRITKADKYTALNTLCVVEALLAAQLSGLEELELENTCTSDHLTTARSSARTAIVLARLAEGLPRLRRLRLPLPGSHGLVQLRSLSSLAQLRELILVTGLAGGLTTSDGLAALQQLSQLEQLALLNFDLPSERSIELVQQLMSDRRPSGVRRLTFLRDAYPFGGACITYQRPHPSLAVPSTAAATRFSLRLSCGKWSWRDDVMGGGRRGHVLVYDDVWDRAVHKCFGSLDPSSKRLVNDPGHEVMTVPLTCTAVVGYESRTDAAAVLALLRPGMEKRVAVVPLPPGESTIPIDHLRQCVSEVLLEVWARWYGRKRQKDAVKADDWVCRQIVLVLLLILGGKFTKYASGYRAVCKDFKDAFDSTVSEAHLKLGEEAVERLANGQASPLARFPGCVNLTIHLDKYDDYELLTGLALFGTTPEARQRLTRVCIVKHHHGPINSLRIVEVLLASQLSGLEELELDVSGNLPDNGDAAQSSARLAILSARLAEGLPRLRRLRLPVCSAKDLEHLRPLSGCAQLRELVLVMQLGGEATTRGLEVLQQLSQLEQLTLRVFDLSSERSREFMQQLMSSHRPPGVRRLTLLLNTYPQLETPAVVLAAADRLGQRSIPELVIDKLIMHQSGSTHLRPDEALPQLMPQLVARCLRVEWRCLSLARGQRMSFISPVLALLGLPQSLELNHGEWSWRDDQGGCDSFWYDYNWEAALRKCFGRLDQSTKRRVSGPCARVVIVPPARTAMVECASRTDAAALLALLRPGMERRVAVVPVPPGESAIPHYHLRQCVSEVLLQVWASSGTSRGVR
eukprot:XP_001689845.1 predicted protein [Chlamydomonas reinhardtii]